MAAQPEPIPAARPDDSDPIETQEWLDALTAVIEREGPERAHQLLEKLIDSARERFRPSRSSAVRVTSRSKNDCDR